MRGAIRSLECPRQEAKATSCGTAKTAPLSVLRGEVAQLEAVGLVEQQAVGGGDLRARSAHAVHVQCT